MKQRNPKTWVTALGAGLIASVVMLPQAKAEMVYESDVTTPGHSAQIEDRSNMRQALGASEKVQVTLQAEAPAPVAAETAPTAPAAVAAAPVAETQNYTKAELMRRERQREELKNEDLLQQRLEELRLRDERRRTDEVLAGGTQAPAVAAAVAPVTALPALKEEIVLAPVTNHPGIAPQAPVAQAVVATDSMNVTSAMAMPVEGTVSDRTMISVAPRAGLSNLVGNQNLFDVHPHFAAGLAARVSASDNLSFELGYTFNEYGIGMASNSPFVLNRQAMASVYGQASFESVAMKQNVLDAGLKLHLLGPDSKLRPFVGGGGAYSKSFVNFNPTILADMNRYYGRNLSPDYETSGFLGYLTTGLDVKIAKSISVGAEFKYYAVLTSRESQNFSDYSGAMYYGQSPYGYGYAAPNQDTAVAGGTLAHSSFYSILGSATFTF